MFFGLWKETARSMSGGPLRRRGAPADGGQKEPWARGKQSNSRRGGIVEGSGDADANRRKGKWGKGSKSAHKGKGSGRAKGSGPTGKAAKGGRKESDSVEVKILSWNVDGFRDRTRQLLILSCLW